VIVSHGFAITPSSYAWLAEHLASHGFVVAAPSHSESLDPSGLWRATVDRPADVVELLAHLDYEVRAGGEFAGLIDTESVAVVGHSYGGYTALAAAGARLDMNGFRDICEHEISSGDPLEFQCEALVEHADDMAALAGLDATPSGLWPTAGDDRIDAVVSVAGDAAMFGTSGLAEISVPVLTIGGTADTDSPLEWGNRLAYEHNSSARKAEVVLIGADHMVFAGGCEQMRRIESLVSLGFCTNPGWDRNEVHDVVNHYVAAFLLAELRADRGAAEALEPANQNVPRTTYRSVGF
jgi:predicted dienelactone hydrolase